MTRDRSTIVIGAGAAGLATAAALKRRSVPCVVLDRSDNVAASWRGRYDGLRLNSFRFASNLPHMRMDRALGDFPSRDDFVDYLERYAARWRIDIRFGVEVTRIDRGEGCLVAETSAGAMHATNVVMASGQDHDPSVPAWPGREGYRNALLHSSSYRNPEPFAGKHVLVVGGGDSGADIALKLSAGGAKHVSISMQSPPLILPPRFLGIPMQLMAIIGEPLPPKVFDVGTRIIQRLVYRDLVGLGLGRPPRISELFARRRSPIFDRGFVAAVRAGRIEIVHAVVAFAGDHVALRDGTTVRPDVVVAATGYRTGLERIVGHLDALDEDGWPLSNGSAGLPSVPGLFFMGFVYPMIGNLRRIGRDARALARRIAG